MVPLFALLLVAASSTRVQDAVTSNQNASAAGLPKKGDKCQCYNTPFYEQSDCCNEGLVCDKKTRTCMPALGHRCERKWGWTECANKETYDTGYGGRQLKCDWSPPHGEARCCIKAGEYAFHEHPGQDGNDPRNKVPWRNPEGDCCSGRWKSATIRLPDKSIYDPAQMLFGAACDD
eukprot:Skav223671  [mRNA]  locus=scaffold2794:329306:329833:- [translate_table: standard]